LRKNKKNNIYFQKLNLKKKAEKRGSKVFPKFKNGQKKCPKKCPVPLFGKKPAKKHHCQHYGLINKKITQKLLR